MRLSPGHSVDRTDEVPLLLPERRVCGTHTTGRGPRGAMSNRAGQGSLTARLRSDHSTKLTGPSWAMAPARAVSPRVQAPVCMLGAGTYLSPAAPPSAPTASKGVEGAVTVWECPGVRHVRLGPHSASQVKKLCVSSTSEQRVCCVWVFSEIIVKFPIS